MPVPTRRNQGSFSFIYARQVVVLLPLPQCRSLFMRGVALLLFDFESAAPSRELGSTSWTLGSVCSFRWPSLECTFYEDRSSPGRAYLAAVDVSAVPQLCLLRITLSRVSRETRSNRLSYS